MCDLPWLICVSEALPASSACFRNELFQVWQCRNHIHAQLCQYRVELRSATFQILTGPHALKLLPSKPVSEAACTLGHLSTLVQELPTWVALEAWLQNDCPSDESIPESNFACSSAFCIKQCSINLLLFFTEALLCFACVQHFILRILRCSINSNNCEGLCPSHREFLSWGVSFGHTVLGQRHRTVGYLLLSSVAKGSGSEWISWELRNIPQSFWLTASCASPQGHVPAHESRWALQKLFCATMTKPLTFADSEVTSLSWCLLHPSLLRPQPCSWVTWVQCCRVGIQSWIIMINNFWVGRDESPGCTQEVPSAGTHNRGSSEVWALLRSRMGEHTLMKKQEPWHAAALISE